MGPSNPLKNHHHQKKQIPKFLRCFSVSFVGAIFRWTCRLSLFCGSCDCILSLWIANQTTVAVGNFSGFFIENAILPEGKLPLTGPLLRVSLCPVWDGEVKWPLKLSLVGWSHRDLHPTFGGWSLVTNWITLVDTFFKSLVWRLVPQPTLKHVMRKSSSSWIMETPKVWARKTYVKTPPGFLFRTKDLSKNVPDFRFYAFCLKSIEGES